MSDFVFNNSNFPGNAGTSATDLAVSRQQAIFIPTAGILDFSLLTSTLETAHSSLFNKVCSWSESKSVPVSDLSNLRTCPGAKAISITNRVRLGFDSGPLP